MKTRGTMLLFFLGALFITIQGLNVGLEYINQFFGLIIGVVLVLISIIFHQLGKRKDKHFFIISYVMNYFATGLSISTYYVMTDNVVIERDIFIAVIIVLISFLLFLLVSLHQNIKSFITALVVLIVIGTYVATITMWIMDDVTINSMLFFVANIGLFNIFVLNRYLIKGTSIFQLESGYSYGAYIVISIVVLVIISEGEVLDAGGIGFGDSKRKDKGTI